MSRYVGLDCGGSATRAVLVDEDLNVLGEGRSGPANLASTPGEEIERHIAESLSGFGKVDAVFGCFAGLMCEADRHRGVWYLVRATGATCEAGPDYFAALTADEAADVVVIAGTGSLVASRVGDAVVKSGGGGIVLADEGSLGDIGRRVLALALLGPKPLTGRYEPLAGVCKEVFGTSEPHEAVASLYREGPIAGRLAKVGVWAVREASHTDWLSEVVSGALGQLAERFVRHLESHWSGAGRVVVRLSGGLWDVDPAVVDRFSSLCAPGLAGLGIGEVEMGVLQIEPVIGAARLARELDEHGI